ncbi:pre-peptidase C-terminal domain-containing protein [Pantanalinema sp. GBBB05]|uniref:pre-peptidase C-terminal domain-containing protein n=1 Tax=Pantanalinema sp. GBBB05 TaxID=2604139 RepID=UPI001DCA27E6|nr:phosphatase PAP2 family protein [Pantanalinema sp. GBBB05]
MPNLLESSNLSDPHQSIRQYSGDLLDQGISSSSHSAQSGVLHFRSRDESNTVRKITAKSWNQSVFDRVGTQDTDDLVCVKVKKTSVLNLSLKGLTADADLALLNQDGRVIQTSSHSGTASESVRVVLEAGTYYVRVHTNGGDTPYRLSVQADSHKKTVRRYADTLQGYSDDNVVLDWNNAMLQAIKAAGTPPPYAARNLAIVHTAIYDAVNSIVHLGQQYYTTVNAPRGASAIAAVAGAAYQTLVTLYPTQKATFDAALGNTLARVVDGKSEQDGLAIGTMVANIILAARSNDGASATVAYTPLAGDEYWHPTAPNFAPALLPQWPLVKPFTMTSDSQFRPDGPPAFTSAQYRSEVDEVRRLGGKVGSERTADQTQIALFWADGGGTYTPPGHWNDIAEDIARQENTSLFEDARLFAMLNIGLADAGIVAWDAKYAYNQCRPIQAIRTSSDPTWTPLINTPPFPDYISGHSTFSGAASSILSYLFGENYSFSTTTDGLPGVVRSYSSFAQAADEAGRSRIYGGIHVESSNQDGLIAGRQLASYIVQDFLIV